MRQRERRRSVSRKRLLADVMHERVRLAHSLRVLCRDLFQGRQGLLSALRLQHCFQMRLVALHLGLKGLGTTGLRRPRLSRLEPANPEQAKQHHQDPYSPLSTHHSISLSSWYRRVILKYSP